ncbi:MAG: 4-hydroxy-tetrahydrodipicolinate reductase [Candidatus Melainabacteria bacterium]|nr:4-hydroxy-tetrahydrodipicolinate reductase [Candidatus Melainabacteria bacterium]
MKDPIRIAISGINGRLGRFCARTIMSNDEFKLVGAFGRPGADYVGQDVGCLVNGVNAGIVISNTFQDVLQSNRPQVVLDFSQAESAIETARLALTSGVRPVVGTSGLKEEDIKAISHIASEQSLGAMIVPNFSIGAVLMVEFARQAASFFSHCEIVEMHHTKKLDAPSGTAMYTASKLAALGREFNRCRAGMQERELVSGSRGSKMDSGVRVHSLRLPGLIAHQEVIFAGEGELFSIRHETINLESLIPGIKMALKAVIKMHHLTRGLENLLLASSPATEVPLKGELVSV